MPVESEIQNTATKAGIGQRLRTVRGPRPLAAMAERVDCSIQQISNMEKGAVPTSYLWLARLREEEGIDLNWLLCGEGNGRA